MVRIENDKLIIEVRHSSPENFLTDLKESLIGAVQFQDLESGYTTEIKHINYTLLELLKNINCNVKG